MPQIEVTFDIDANGIVNVSAKDKATNKEHSIVIQLLGGLSDSEIERMVQEAEASKADDERKKALVDARNDADSLVYNTERQLSEHKDKLDEATVGEIEAQISQLKSELEGEDVEAIKENGDSGTGREEQAKEAQFEEKGSEGEKK